MTARTGSKIVLALTLLAYLASGRAPGMRELRNPDAESGLVRVAAAAKRSPPT